MSFWEAVLCGIVQGLTEFLPVSSSGHLALMHGLFGLTTSESNMTFDMLLHLATLLVVVLVYFREIFALIPAFFTMLGKAFHGKHRLADYSKEERTVLFLIVATVPLVAAFFLKEPVQAILQNTRIVGIFLILNGILLLVTDFAASRRTRKSELSMLGAVTVGLFQTAALLPGISRSGSTISGGLLSGLDRQDAVRFSFLLSIPAIVGANVFQLPEAFSTPVPKNELLCYGIGMACAMIFGFLAIKLLLWMAKKEKFGFFAVYCMAIGTLAVLFAH